MPNETGILVLTEFSGSQLSGLSMEMLGAARMTSLFGLPT